MEVRYCYLLVRRPVQDSEWDEMCNLIQVQFREDRFGQAEPQIYYNPLSRRGVFRPIWKLVWRIKAAKKVSYTHCWWYLHKGQSQFWSLVLHCNFTAELWSYSIWSFKLSWDLPSGRMRRLDAWKEFVEDNTFGAFFSWFWERNIVLDSLRELWKLELFCLVILGAIGDLYWKNDWFFFLELCF